jgi:hypothetical protein
MMVLSKLIEWWEAAAPGERARLAKAMKTSQHYLRSHLMPGERRASADYAAKLEASIASINAAHRGEPLPEVDRRDLCSACNKCPFGKEG